MILLETSVLVPALVEDLPEHARAANALGLSGGVVYDALHLCTAEKAGADRLVTFNRRDFERFAAVTEVEFVFL